MGQWMELTAASCCFSILGCCIQWLHAYITNCRADVWWAFFQTIRPSGLCQRSGISIHYLWDVVCRDALDTTLRSLNVYLPGKASDFFFFLFLPGRLYSWKQSLEDELSCGVWKEIPTICAPSGSFDPSRCNDWLQRWLQVAWLEETQPQCSCWRPCGRAFPKWNIHWFSE